MGKAWARMDFAVCFFFVLIVCPSKIHGITTVHHDKPEESTIPKMATKMLEAPEKILNITLSSAERQKRLLPYENFYLTQPFNQAQKQPLYEHEPYRFENPAPKKIYAHFNYQQDLPLQDILYQSNNKVTPFHESNAIPGPFRPMSNNQPSQRPKVQYVSLSQPQQGKVPNYSAIYDKLAQLKLQQNSRRPQYVQTYNQPQRYVSKPRINFVPANNYKIIQPTKTTIETFTATSIDLSSGQEVEEYIPPQQHVDLPTTVKNYQDDIRYVNAYRENTKPFVNQQIAIEVPHSSYAQEDFGHVSIQKPYREHKYLTRKPYFVLQARPEDHRIRLQPVQKPVLLLHRKPVFKEKPLSVPIVEEKYIAEKLIPYNAPKYLPEIPKFEPQVTRLEPQVTQYEPEYEVTPIYDPQYLTPKYQTYQTLQPVTEPPSTENSNSLGQILKQLQDTNTLPQTLTADNIDNSIKTLVKILEALKKQQKFSKPIVVQDEISSDYNEDIQNEAGVGISGQAEEVPGTVVENFPDDTPDGGTPGKAGVDYPALSTIPQTSFNCKTQRYKGFFGDPDTHCQVWHYCDLNGGQASFLCPNGTIFSQVALTCDWWYNVKCSTTAQLYVLNERLYKYIIPLSPKFPEDYSGPLVDKYLALKFQEMEEKMRKEKKGKGNGDKENEKDELQHIENDDTEKASGQETTTNSQEKETLETIEDANEQ